MFETFFAQIRQRTRPGRERPRLTNNPRSSALWSARVGVTGSRPARPWDSPPERRITAIAARGGRQPMDVDVAVLQQSFRRLTPKADALASNFYDTLFEKSPEA